jgi:hypothetical protein
LEVWKFRAFFLFKIRLVQEELLTSPAGMHAGMRLIHAAVAVPMAITVALIAPVVLMAASPAHADDSGYRRCVGNLTELPLNEPDPRSLQLAGEIEQDLHSGVSPAAEARKVARMGFDPRAANVVVHCVAQENP